jgi:hypothetical protein
MSIRRTGIFVAGAIAAAVIATPAASAKPDCVNLSPNTTQCRNSGGSSQIITSPPVSNCGAWGCGYWGYGGWGNGGLVIDFLP